MTHKLYAQVPYNITTKKGKTKTKFDIDKYDCDYDAYADVEAFRKTQPEYIDMNGDEIDKELGDMYPDQSIYEKVRFVHDSHFQYFDELIIEQEEELEGSDDKPEYMRKREEWEKAMKAEMETESDTLDMSDLQEPDVDPLADLDNIQVPDEEEVEEDKEEEKEEKRHDEL